MHDLQDWTEMKHERAQQKWQQKKPILCLDFDGVIHYYTTWSKVWVIDGGPVPGAMRFIWDASEHFTLAIYSARSKNLLGRWAMKRWLRIEFQRHWASDRTHADDILAEIKWPWFKPIAKVTIDDRAIQFKGRWPDIQVLKHFKPWNKRSRNAAQRTS